VATNTFGMVGVITSLVHHWLAIYGDLPFHNPFHIQTYRRSTGMPCEFTELPAFTKASLSQNHNVGIHLGMAATWT
jgi:hypothetical protein